MIEKRTLLPHTITPGLFTTILDSGATSHLIKDRGYFIDFVKEDCPPVKTANQGMLRTSGCGSCVVEIALGKDTYCLILKECLHAPGALLNLLSVGHMLNHGWGCEFKALLALPFVFCHIVGRFLDLCLSWICNLCYLPICFLHPDDPKACLPLYKEL